MNGHNQVTFILGQRKGLKYIQCHRPERSLFSSSERVFSTGAPASKYELKTAETKTAPRAQNAQYTHLGKKILL